MQQNTDCGMCQKVQGPVILLQATGSETRLALICKTSHKGERALFFIVVCLRLIHLKRQNTQDLIKNRSYDDYCSRCGVDQ